MEIPRVKDKVEITNAKIVTNEAAQKATANSPSNAARQNAAVSFSRETPEADIVLDGADGHVVTIHDNAGDRTQHYRYFVECAKERWQARVHTFEQAMHAADQHVYHNTKPRLK